MVQVGGTRDEGSEWRGWGGPSVRTPALYHSHTYFHKNDSKRLKKIVGFFETKRSQFRTLVMEWSSVANPAYEMT